MWYVQGVGPKLLTFHNPIVMIHIQRAIFGNDWICVGLKEKVEKAGNFFTGILSDNPYIVVRDGDTLRAFYNVCRHHAAQVTPIGSEGCTNK